MRTDNDELVEGWPIPDPFVEVKAKCSHCKNINVTLVKQSEPPYHKFWNKKMKCGWCGKNPFL
jgi:hypothetical protein